MLSPRALVLVLVAVGAVRPKVVKNKCVTPDGRVGFCVDLESCPTLWANSNDFDSPMTIERFNFLKDSFCGILDNKTKACCSLEEIKATTQ